jgi:LPXTG-motif cell wall-anchored protein
LNYTTNKIGGNDNEYAGGAELAGKLSRKAPVRRLPEILLLIGLCLIVLGSVLLRRKSRG